MAKRMKEKVKKVNLKFIIMIIFIVIIAIILIMCGNMYEEKSIVTDEKDNLNEKKENMQESQAVEEKYIIKDFKNFSFNNAEIETENGISYVNIEAKNNSNKISEIQKITIVFSGKTKQLELAYTLPEIEANMSYNIQLNVIEDLSDILSIEVKE